MQVTLIRAAPVARFVVKGLVHFPERALIVESLETEELPPSRDLVFPIIGRYEKYFAGVHRTNQ